MGKSASRRNSSAPLIPIELLPARITEVAFFNAGLLTDEELPSWVRSLGVSLAEALLPNDWLLSANLSPKLFFEGLGMGIAAMLRKQGMPTDFAMDFDKVSRALSGSVNANGGQVDAKDVLSKISHSKEIGETITDRLGGVWDMESKLQIAFLHGYLIGLDFEKAANAGMAEMVKKQKSKKDFIVLKTFLWLTWPEVQAQGNISEVFDYCARKFRSTETPHIMGSDEAFRRFCNRIGLSFKTGVNRTKSVT